ncbi:MAG: ceramidase domain-containing protein [Bdellovibrionales bacterium]|nr:ceramidase domain-containing protein [Bdellovibrionales bacterium]
MSAFNAPRLPEGCPWAEWSPPNIHWCEENLCSWITTPANTWSNLAYLAVGALLWKWWRADRAAGKGAQAAALGIFPPAAVAIGLTSFAFHASYTFFFQFFDYVGMYTLFCLLIVLNLRRSGRVQPSFLVPAYLIGICGMSALVPVMHAAGIPVQLTIAGLLALILAQELWLRFDGRRKPEYRELWRALGAFGLGFVFTLLDGTRTWCDPSNHWLQGHALWHVFTALALPFLYRFYRPLL